MKRLLGLYPAKGRRTHMPQVDILPCDVTIQGLKALQNYKQMKIVSFEKMQGTPINQSSSAFFLLHLLVQNRNIWMQNFMPLKQISVGGLQQLRVFITTKATGPLAVHFKWLFQKQFPTLPPWLAPLEITKTWHSTSSASQNLPDPRAAEDSIGRGAEAGSPGAGGGLG